MTAGKIDLCVDGIAIAGACITLRKLVMFETFATSGIPSVTRYRGSLERYREEWTRLHSYWMNIADGNPERTAMYNQAFERARVEGKDIADSYIASQKI